MNLHEFFSQKSRLTLTIIGFLLLALVGGIDFVTGNQYSVAVFYLIPIGFITWFAGRIPGFLAAFAGALVWLFDEYTAVSTTVHPTVPFWNASMMFCFFLIVSYLLSELEMNRTRQKEEEKGPSTDEPA